MKKVFKYVIVDNNKIKEELKKRDVVLKEVADNLDITYRSLTNKFNGSTEFKLSEVLSICKTYDIDVNDLIDMVLETHYEGGR